MGPDFRVTRIITVCVGLFLGILIASCGGDDDSTTVSAEAQAVPANFTSSVLVDDPLTVTGTVSPDTQPVNAVFLQFAGAQQNFINGTYTQGQRTWNLKSGSRFPVIMTLPNLGNANPRTFNLSISVASPVFIARDLRPSSGTLEVTDGAGDIIQVIFNNPSAGVSISLNGASAVPFTMDEFQNLPGSGAPDWQQEAYLSFVALEFMIFPLATSREIIDDILTNRDDLTSKISLQIPCDSLADSTTQISVPASIPDQGLETLAWVDSSGNSQIDTGDGFSLTFADCFNQDMGVIFNAGFLKLLGFTDQRENSSIIRIGFEPAEGSSGGISFMNTGIWISQKTTSGQVIDGTTMLTVNGGFSLVFSQ